MNPDIHISRQTILIIALVFVALVVTQVGCSTGGTSEACIQNGFGAKFCGQDAKDYCSNLDASGANDGNDGFSRKSAQVCETMRDQ